MENLKLIKKNYKSTDADMVSNFSHSLTITLGEVLSFDSVSEFLLYLIVSTSTLLTTVGPMLYKLIIEK